MHFHSNAHHAPCNRLGTVHSLRALALRQHYGAILEAQYNRLRPDRRAFRREAFRSLERAAAARTVYTNAESIHAAR